MRNPVLSITDIKCGYGDTEILHGISASVSAGQALGVLGRNGVGKTTLSRALIGDIRLQSGKIELDRKTIGTSPPFERRRKGMGYMPQTNMVFDSLTVRENLAMASANSAMDAYFDIFPRLAERLDQQAGSMSGGERKILAFVRVMLEDTYVIILDEPSEGVQTENIENMQRCIEARRDEGTSFVLIEQNLTMLMSISDSYLGLDSGHVVFRGSRQESTRDDLLAVLEV